ncbi:hypothetical protein STCU_08099 [Strigomonas culicis]|uniref:Exocyst complex component Sec3 coiled-coil domain-containing protein n=1 Tax=Strigomonas culicis TaxID=28005 RepID=S9U1W8_9TRYP|nr:hypothetical protein STCU_08099 [Strigomonas culicis]|eukprot:EPY22839.1 hypothetical protein STCU_08099 [Strigomonas culicis]
MNRLGDAKPAVEAVFRQRLEDVVTGEIVTEMGGKQRVAKPRLLLLCRSMATAASASATLNIVSVEEGGRKVKLKQTFVVERLVEVSHDGDFDATFNFGASGMLSVSFESHIQREMFIAAARRTQGALQSGRQQGMLPGTVRGVLTDTIGAAAEADAASRVRKLRREKQRVFSQEEEQHLMKYMNARSFDDVQRFQEVLLQWQKEAELSSLDALVKSSYLWGQVRGQVQDLVGEVEELEGRIEHYTTNLLSKKGVIQQIEHENNTLQRQQQNLDELYVILADLRDQLSLSPAATNLLTRLRAEPEASLVAFFAESQNAATLSAAMKQMHHVLHNKKLAAEFPIAAVAERKVYFLEQRRLIALRSHTYIYSVIGDLEAQYASDKSRFSHGSTLVWRLHDELSQKLRAVGDILLALPRIDMERYTRTQRRYCVSMQRIYTLEISRFLTCLRRNVRKTSRWRGPFLLGTGDTLEAALETRMETAQVGETPPLWRGSPTASPPLTPRLFRFGDDTDSHGGGGRHSRSNSLSGGSSAGASAKGRLSIECPSTAAFPGVDLYADPTVLQRIGAQGAVSAAQTGLRSLFGSDTGGNLRPDLALALALQSVMVALLYEESLLGDCFGMREAGGPDSGEPAPFDYQEAERALEQSLRDRDLAQPSFKPEEYLQESLMELFGGDKTGLIAPPTEKVEEVRGRNISLARPLDNFPHRSFGGGGGSFRNHSGQLGAADGSERPTADPAQTAAHQHLRQNYLVAEMTDFAAYMMERCDRLYAIPALCMVRAYRNPTAMPATARSVFCQSILAEMEKVLSAAMMRCIAEQTESIARCKRQVRHPAHRAAALLHQDAGVCAAHGCRAQRPRAARGGPRRVFLRRHELDRPVLRRAGCRDEHQVQRERGRGEAQARTGPAAEDPHRV